MQISLTKLRVAVWLVGLLMSAAVSATADDELGIVRVTDSPEGLVIPAAAGVGYTPLESAFEDDGFGIQQVSATMCDACPIVPCEATQCAPSYAGEQYGDGLCAPHGYATQGCTPYGCGPQGCTPSARCGSECADCCEMKPIKIYSIHSLCYPLHKVFNTCSRLKCWLIVKCHNSKVCQWWHCQSLAFAARNQYCCEELGLGAKKMGRKAKRAAHKRLHNGVCAWLSPQANCGEGVALVGHYNMTYAVQPDYFDQRDGRLYSAQGYGIPITVPLAPNVRHTYNYGWGIPSSRLTPVSHPYGQ